METKIHRSWFKDALKHLHGLAYWLYDRAYTSYLMELNDPEYKAKRDHFIKERFLDCVVLTKYNIIVALKDHSGGAWAAYASYEGVRGFHREDDLYDSWRHGAKVDVSVARALFPKLSKKYGRYY